MNIYFSCSITGGRQDQAAYQTIVDFLLAEGHEVPTAHLAHPDVMSYEASVDPVEIYERDSGWMLACDAVVAEVSTPSHGVGYEIALGLLNSKPVLCLYQEGRRVSKMITGNTQPAMVVQSYTTSGQAVALVREFLKEVK